MARKRRKGRTGSATLRLAFLACAFHLLPAVPAEPTPPILFSEIKVIREIAPMYPGATGPRGAGKGIPKGRSLEEKDLLARAKKRWRLSVEDWPLDADSAEGGKLAVLHGLVENGGLGFQFTTEATGTHSVEVQAPRAPQLGPFSIRIGDRNAGVVDPWAPQPEPSSWIRFPNPIELAPGVNRIDLLQLSPTDSPLVLRAFRFAPFKGDTLNKGKALPSDAHPRTSERRNAP